MRLARNYRFAAKNDLGQTIAIAGIEIKARRFRIGSDNRIEWEASEATVFSNAGTLADNTFLGEDAQNNSSDDWLGGDFEITVIGPTSASGDVVIYYQTSTDEGTTWPDDEQGVVVAVFVFSTAETQRRQFRIA